MKPSNPFKKRLKTNSQFFDPESKQIFKRVANIVLRKKYTIFFGMLCMIGYAALNGSIPLMIKTLTDTVASVKTNQEPLEIYRFILVGAAIVIIFATRGLFYFGQTYLLSSLGQFLIRNLRKQLFNATVKLPFTFFHRRRTGDIISRFTTDLSVIEQAVYISITGPIRDLPSIFIFLGILLYINSVLFLFSLLMIPPVLLIINIFGKRVKRVTRKKQSKSGDLVSTLTESVTGIQVVKSFHKEEFEKEKFEEENQKLYQFSLKSILISASSSPIIEIIGASCVSFIIVYGSWQFIQGIITAGEFLQFLTAFYMLNEPIKRFNGFHLKLQEGFSAAERVFEIIDTENPIIKNNPKAQLPSFQKELRIKIDKFSYDRQVILKNIDITIPAGKAVAFVGSSGSGKSTIANLIPRFFDFPEEDGGIYFDGHDIRKYDVYSLRNQIAVVDQNTVLFNDTVKNNIAYGEPEISLEKVKEVSKLAHAYDFVMSLDNQFEQRIGEKGVLISGGQKQRISIARAMLKNTPILILDEATSALDSESEQEVQAALENSMKNKTTLIIAHRFSTIRNVENIFVLKEGEIIETGNHDELMEMQGEYYRLYNIQSQS